MSFQDAFNRRRRPAPDDEYYPNGIRRGVWDERTPSGESPMEMGLPPHIREMLREATIRGQRGSGPNVPPELPNGQVLTPTNQDAITRPRTVTPSFKAAFTRPQPIPTEMRGEAFGESGEAFGSTRPRRTQPRDYIADDEAYLRDLQNQPRTWKDKVVDAADIISEAGFGNKPRRTMTPRERELAKTQGRLKTGLETQKTQAQIGALQQKPQYQQDVLEERGINNALSQYNRLEHYDPDDPADAALRKYFESRGLALPKKDKYRRPIATWANGQLVLTDDAGTRRATIDGEVVEDEARKPTEVTVGDQTFQVPQTQAEQSVRQRTTAEANRAAADTRSRRSQEGQDRRLDKRLAAPSKAGTRGATVDRAAQRKAATLVGTIERARRTMELADAKGDAKTRDEARLIGEQAAAELNALGAGYEAGPGEKGYPYYKQGGQQAQPAQGRTIDGAVQAFTRKVGRAPTAEEIAKMKAALGQ